MIETGIVMILTLVGAIWAVSQPSIVRAIFGLGVALAGVALAFLLLNSPFLAAMEVLIYIGGITVAMAFGVMLSSAGRTNEPGESAGRRVLAAIGSGAFFVGMVLVIRSTAFTEIGIPAEERWSVQAIGKDLLNHYNVVFEVLSVVLLVAIVGAITIASRRHESADPTTPEENAP